MTQLTRTGQRAVERLLAGGGARAGQETVCDLIERRNM